MLNLITGGAGSGKSTELMNQIESAVSTNKNVYVIIPDQFSFEFDRLLYKRLGMKNFNKVTVLSFERLSTDIFIKHGGLKGSYADDIVKTVLMFRTLSQVTKNEGLIFYNKQARSPNFIDSSLDIVKELILSNISPEMLTDSLNFMNENIKNKISDISVIFSEYSRVLTESGYKDGLNDISAAAKKASDVGYFRGLDVFIDEFKSFTADERVLLDVIISESNSVTGCFTTEEKVPTAFSVFETANKTIGKLVKSAQNSRKDVNFIRLENGVRFKSESIEFLSKNILRNVRGKFSSEPHGIKVYEASDIYNEMDFVCAEICRLVMENGYKYNDIAVAVRQKEVYSSIAEGAFNKYNIPFYTDENKYVQHKALIVFVLTALKIAADKAPDTEDYLRYIKTGFIGLNEKQIDLIEEYCYKWNVTSTMWKEAFIDDEAEILRLKICNPLNKFALLSANCSGDKICRNLFEFFDDINLTGTIKSIISECESTEPDIIISIREYKQLWELLCGLIETLNTVLGQNSISLVEFTDLFEASVKHLKLSNPPQSLDSVLFVAVHTARLSNPKIVFVLGVNDGELPLAVKTGGLFSDRDRIALEAAGIELSGASADKIAEERFVAYNILSSPSEKLYISYPLAGISGNALYPSVLIKQIISIFGNNVKTTFTDIDLLSLCMTPNSSYYQFVQNFNKNNADSLALRKALLSVSEYSDRIKYLENLKFNKQHFLDEKISSKLFGNRMYVSASSFEDYQKCPFIFFCKKGLNLYPRRRVDINASAQGNVIHYCLCELFKDINSSGKTIREESESAIKNKINLYMKTYYNCDEIKGDYGKSKRFKETYNKLSNTITDVAMHLKNELSQSKFNPSEFEYTIKRDGDESPLKLTASDGTEIFFIGTIDRIDTYKDAKGEIFIRVVDYKSGTQSFNLTNLLYGLNMQMFLYLFALTEKSDGKIDGKYKETSPAGVLYMPAKGTAPALERDDDDVEALKNSTYKMDGLVLDDDRIIHAMEADLSGVYIPLKYLKAGGLDKKSRTHVLDKNQLENLRKYSKKLIINMTENLKSGKIPASPLENKNSSPCNYCDYSSVCSHTDMTDCTRTIAPKDEAMEKLNLILGDSKEVLQ